MGVSHPSTFTDFLWLCFPSNTAEPHWATLTVVRTESSNGSTLTLFSWVLAVGQDLGVFLPSHSFNTSASRSPSLPQAGRWCHSSFTGSWGTWRCCLS
jgi:hypothetical protein